MNCSHLRTSAQEPPKEPAQRYLTLVLLYKNSSLQKERVSFVYKAKTGALQTSAPSVTTGVRSARHLLRGPRRTRRLRRPQAPQVPRRQESWQPAVRPQAPLRVPPPKRLPQRLPPRGQGPQRRHLGQARPPLREQEQLQGRRTREGQSHRQLRHARPQLQVPTRPRVPFFGSGSHRVLGGASFVIRNVGGLAFISCRSFGTPSGDKRNAGHSDPVPLRHELGQGWSAAKPNPDAIINTLL
jgi:hypothetical protein